MAEVAPKSVLYCKICSWPPEYCEFGSSFKRCQAWLQENNEDLYNQLYSNANLSNQLSSLSIEKEAKLSADLEKKQAKEEAKAEKELAKKLMSKITIKRIERNKRKHIISISGMEVLEMDLKKICKTFANKFATGSTVQKNAEGKNDILIQGDVSDEAKEIIEKLLTEQGLKDVKIEQVDDKKIKKKQAAQTQTK
ncbi:unnamed protein product [Candida verbasci]|uniref:Translation machinery-associated protein 22 n=1 Tax=Candida verbasci TaxID=1227364 RepID=A0A9W4U051_9ASCO|nr:unnamed protein product [Candida verbasci]